MTTHNPEAELFVAPAQLAALSDTPQCIRNAAARFEQQPYGVGGFLAQSSEEDLTSLYDLGVAAQTNDQARITLVLFTVMLLNGEGIAVRISEELTQYARRLLLMVQMELMSRYGMVKMDHGALTLEKPFDPAEVELTEKGKQIYGSIKVKKV